MLCPPVRRATDPVQGPNAAPTSGWMTRCSGRRAHPRLPRRNLPASKTDEPGSHIFRRLRLSPASQAGGDRCAADAPTTKSHQPGCLERSARLLRPGIRKKTAHRFPPEVILGGVLLVASNRRLRADQARTGPTPRPTGSRESPRSQPGRRGREPTPLHPTVEDPAHGGRRQDHLQGCEVVAGHGGHPQTGRPVPDHADQAGGQEVPLQGRSPCS